MKNDSFYSHAGLGFDYNLSLLTSLMIKAKQKDAKLTPEEREEKDRRIQERREKERIEYSINQGKCPKCDSKLSRGKKDKNNNYKRLWTCLNCDSKYYR